MSMITEKHCLAVHDAIKAGTITEDAPISDALMAPFIEAAEQHVADGKKIIDASRLVQHHVYHTLRDTWRAEAGDDLVKRQATHRRAQAVENAVVAGLKARDFPLQ